MAKKRLNGKPASIGRREDFMGMWVAWNSKLTKIVACGRSWTEAADRAKRAGEPKPVLENLHVGLRL